MHLVVDMQGAQTGSRFRGIGRLTLSLVKAIVRHRGEHQVTLALSGLFPDSIKPLTEEFAGLLPEQNIHVWNGIGPTQASNAENNRRREVSERLREASLASLRPDVVLITSLFEGYTDNAVLSIGLLATDTPTAALFYDLIPLRNPSPEFKDDPFQQAWYQKKLDALKQCQCLLSISEYTRQEAISGLGLEPNRVSLIGCGCDPSFRDLALTQQEKDGVRQAHGIRKPFVMYTGGGDISKNLGRLILAFARLDKDLRDRHELVLVGNLERHDVQKLQAIARVSGMNPDDLRFAGFVSDEELVRLYNTCSVFVFPSLHEGFGLPPLEAMACGTPVLASNTTSLPEVVGLKEAMFDPLSLDDIVGKLHLALTDLEYRARLISHGKEQAKRFSWDQSAAQAWNSLSTLRGASRGDVSPLITVDRTGIFGKRPLRLLVTKLDHLGDFILSIPALAKLRTKYPDAEIDIIVGSWNVALARELGFFRNVYSFDYFKRKSSNKPFAEDEELSNVLRSLGTYDIGIDMRRQPESRFVLVRANAALKVGYQTFDQQIDDQLDVMLRAYKEGAHVRTPLNVTPIGKQIVRLVDALPDNVNDFISLPPITAKATASPGRVAIFPKAGTDAREWNRDRFIKLVGKFMESPEVTDIHVCFVSADEAAEYGFAESSKLHVQIGLEFPALSRLLASASLCVANNSGGIHLASYLGIPVIGIYSGHELAAEWGPQFHGSVAIHRNADCAPCHLGRKIDCPYDNFCLGDISVEDVYRKSMETLAAGTTPSPSLDRSSRQEIGLQLNADAIVKELINNLAGHLDPADPQSLIDTSTIIARNHPTYSMLRESDLAYANIVNVELDHRSKVIQWLGFSGAEPEFRWTDGPSVTMQFYLEDEGEVPANARLLLVVDTFGKQRIIAKFNGIQVYDAIKSGKRALITLQVRNMRYGLNKLELHLPNATRPGTDDSRQLGVAIRKLKIAVEDEAISGIVRRASRLKDSLIRWQ